MMYKDLSHLINCIAITLFFILLGADDQSFSSLLNGHKQRIEDWKPTKNTSSVFLPWLMLQSGALIVFF